MLCLYCKNYRNADIAKLYHLVENALDEVEPTSELHKDLNNLFIFLKGVIEGRLK